MFTLVAGFAATAIGLAVGIFITVWPPQTKRAKGAWGGVAALLFISGVASLIFFAPVEWRSPIVFRSPDVSAPMLVAASPVSKSTPSAIDLALQRQNESLKHDNSRLRAENTRLRAPAATPISTPVEPQPLREQDFIDIAKAQEILDNANVLLSAAWDRYYLVTQPAPNDPGKAIPRSPYNSNDQKMAYDDVGRAQLVQQDAKASLDNLFLRLCGKERL